jgi:hypothetical protein
VPGGVDRFGGFSRNHAGTLIVSEFYATRNRELGTAHPDYLGLILTAARKHRFPGDYIEQIEPKLPTLAMAIGSAQQIAMGQGSAGRFAMATPCSSRQAATSAPGGVKLALSVQSLASFRHEKPSPPPTSILPPTCSTATCRLCRKSAHWLCGCSLAQLLSILQHQHVAN